ncbi:hypothetical protein Q0N03_14210, partial [Staphylococcus aureus]|nr:hypothetical protein [Staphylococcus aureus]
TNLDTTILDMVVPIESQETCHHEELFEDDERFKPKNIEETQSLVHEDEKQNEALKSQPNLSSVENFSERHEEQWPMLIFEDKIYEYPMWPT